MQGSLATAENEEVWNFINSVVLEQNHGGGVWLGGRRRCPSSCERWDWAGPLHWSWTNWAVGEPNNEQEKCLEIYLKTPTPFERNYGWNDVDCQSKRNFICKMAK